MKDLLMKKLMQAESMPKQEKSGKLAALRELIKQMDEIMASDMESPMEDGQEMQKVSVMASDEEGLKKGLEKAEDVLEDKELGIDLAPSSEEEYEDEEM